MSIQIQGIYAGNTIAQSNINELNITDIQKGPEIYAQIQHVNLNKSTHCSLSLDKTFVDTLDKGIEEFLSSEKYRRPKLIDTELCERVISNYYQHEEEENALKILRKDAKDSRDKLKEEEIKKEIEIKKEKERLRQEEELKEQQKVELENARKEGLVKEFSKLTGLNNNEEPAKFQLQAQDYHLPSALQNQFEDQNQQSQLKNKQASVRPIQTPLQKPTRQLPNKSYQEPSNTTLPNQPKYNNANILLYVTHIDGQQENITISLNLNCTLMNVLLQLGKQCKKIAGKQIDIQQKDGKKVDFKTLNSNLNYHDLDKGGSLQINGLN